MKMKMFLGLTAATLIVASCSNREDRDIPVHNPDAIGFEMSTGKTRADIANLQTLQQDGNGFNVFASRIAIDGTQETFIHNQAYKYQGGLWEWDGTPVSWPASGEYPLNFVAYYPATEFTLTSQNVGAADYTVKAEDKQIDVMAACALGVSERPVTNKVSLNFKHILSKINFKMKSSAGATVEVQSVKIMNVGNERQYEFRKLEWLNAPGSFATNYTFVAAPVRTGNTFPITASSNQHQIVNDNKFLMLMPQDLADQAWNEKDINGIKTQSYVEVVYRVYLQETPSKDIVGISEAQNHPNWDSANPPANVSATAPLFLKVGFPLNTQWKAGNSYTYTLHLGDPHTSGGYGTDTNFVDKDGNDSNLPAINPGTGDTIVPTNPANKNLPIGFDVSVTDWGAEEEIGM